MLVAFTAGNASPRPALGEERMISKSPGPQTLTNASVWSADSRWIVFDRRSVPAGFDGREIAIASVESGECRSLYQTPEQTFCGVASFHPTLSRIIFIQSPSPTTADWSYGFSRRRGIWVDVSQPLVGHSLDAMNYAPPFVAGALRGGSHIHVYSPDGTRVSFTYEDEILTKLSGSAVPNDGNQRNIGVSFPAGQQVTVNRNHPRNHDGEWRSVLVTQTVAAPRPGSDEILRACEESWVGKKGYTRADGSPQPHALAFQGTVVSATGEKCVEVFIVDLPERFEAGATSLEGTETRRPGVPRGVEQRRLTYTTKRTFPGIQGPRHWLQTAPDGSQIAFLMKDERGVPQLWTVSPRGSQPRQVSRLPAGIASAFTWSPDGKFIAHVSDHSVFLTAVETGESVRLTARTTESPLPEACVFSPDGKWVAYMRNEEEAGKRVPKTYIVPASAGPRLSP